MWWKLSQKGKGRRKNIGFIKRIFLIFYHEEIFESIAMNVAPLILLKEMITLATTRIISIHQGTSCSLAQNLFESNLPRVIKCNKKPEHGPYSGPAPAVFYIF